MLEDNIHRLRRLQFRDPGSIHQLVDDILLDHSRPHYGGLSEIRKPMDDEWVYPPALPLPSADSGVHDMENGPC